jgi:hypothetical protein
MKKKKQKKNKQHKIQNENSRRTGVRGRERKSNDRPSSTVGEREVGGRSIPRRERESCRSSYAAAEMTGPLSYSLFYLSLSLLHSLAIPPPPPTHFLPPPVGSQRATRRTLIHFRLCVCMWVHGRDPVYMTLDRCRCAQLDGN